MQFAILSKLSTKEAERGWKELNMQCKALRIRVATNHLLACKCFVVTVFLVLTPSWFVNQESVSTGRKLLPRQPKVEAKEIEKRGHK